MAADANGAIWAYLRKGMGKRWHAERIENAIGSDVPDVTFALNGREGWIELKHVKAWPSRASTKVRAKLTVGQMDWLSERGNYGSNMGYVLLKVDRTFLLFGREAFAALVDGDTQERLRARARIVWERRINWNQLAKALQFLEFEVEGEA